MKIGQVVQDYGIPVNRLYFYINNGLLVPPRRGSQYEFDERTLEDLRWLLQLKEMGFPLKSIHRLLSLRRISGFNSPEDQKELESIYRAQIEELQRREEQLAEARSRIAEQLQQQRARQSEAPRTGVPLSMLSLLCCPKCGGELDLSDVSMNQKYIFGAGLHCRCGYHAEIRDGVLLTPHRNESLYDKPDTTRELYRDLPSMTLSLFERSYLWLEDRIRGRVPRGRVWLEGYVNAWFFFHNHLGLLHEDDCLIVTDKFPETLYAYKAVIDRQKPACRILYIADSSLELPLRRGIADCSMDFFASNEHNFYRQDFYLSCLRPWLKPDCTLMGVYFHFKNGTNSMHRLLTGYPESSRNNFDFGWFRRSLEKDFRLLETEDVGFSLDSGSNLGLGFHAPGEELHLQPYLARLK